MIHDGMDIHTIKNIYYLFFLRQKCISDSGESDDIKVKVTSGS
jgi:hypothetical protein